MATDSIQYTMAYTYTTWHYMSLRDKGNFVTPTRLKGKALETLQEINRWSTVFSASTGHEMRFNHELLDPFVRFFQFFPKVTATEWPSTRSNADCDPDISDLHCIFRALAYLHRREQLSHVALHASSAKCPWTAANDHFELDNKYY